MSDEYLDSSDDDPSQFDYYRYGSSDEDVGVSNGDVDPGVSDDDFDALDVQQGTRAVSTLGELDVQRAAEACFRAHARCAAELVPLLARCPTAEHQLAAWNVARAWGRGGIFHRPQVIAVLRPHALR